MSNTSITVEVTINALVDKVWEYWNDPKHIEQWAFASDDWEASDAENDLKVGGVFKTTMSAKDKSQSFEFGGVYTSVIKNELIEYSMDDDRKVRIEFAQTSDGTTVTETFDLESQNTADVQREGWQAILDNFKEHVETN